MRLPATSSIVPATDERSYFAHVFAWMAAALAVSGGVAAAIGHSRRALHAVLESGGGHVFLGLLLIELLLVASLVGFVKHMDVFEAATAFLGYAALNGVTLSVIYAIYTTRSVYATFLVTAGMFAGLAVVGATTSVDLTSWGSFLGMALWGLVLALLVNLVWFNAEVYWATTVVGVLLFSALTAYDVQRLKRYDTAGQDGETVEKSSIVGALALYLDFVNLFLYVLRLLGRRR